MCAAWGNALQGLVGMSASYLNDIIAKHEAGLVTDLLDFLNEPWAKLYQHDEFFTIRTELLASAAPFFDAKGNNDAIKSMTIDVLLAFVRSHIAELPGYHLPTSAFK